MTLLQRAAQHPKWIVLGLVVLAVVAVAAYPIFAPKASTVLDQPAMPGATTHATGQWRDGEVGHTARGTVTVVQGGDGAWALRFEGYDATAGPDVYFFLTPGAMPRTTAEVESGLRVLVPGGSDGGEATLRGNFNVPLPADFDPARYRGIAAWCDQFNVLFGWAALG